MAEPLDPGEKGLAARTRERAQRLGAEARDRLAHRRTEGGPIDLLARIWERDHENFGSVLGSAVAFRLFLFLFALTMIFGESKPEGETKMLRSVQDTAIFPLATPSIASPGAMMGVPLRVEISSPL